VVEAVAIDWTMFKKELILGEGSFGTVWKVKSLITSSLSETRVRSALKGCSRNHGLRSLIDDESYVIKVIETCNVHKNAAIEALTEIDLLAQIDCAFIVAYLDSFIEDTRINIIMEFCHHGDLGSFI
jgi:serine/threonine protein kinase